MARQSQNMLYLGHEYHVLSPIERARYILRHRVRTVSNADANRRSSVMLSRECHVLANRLRIYVNQVDAEFTLALNAHAACENATVSVHKSCKYFAP